MTTVGASVIGLLGLCESGQLAVPGEGLCGLDVRADARLIDGTAELVLVTGNPSRWVRPTISFGLGVRSFDFAVDQLDCDQYGGELDDAYQVCRRSSDIIEDPSVNPMLIFGLGLEADRKPLSAFVRLYTVTGSYSGGTGLSDGGRQLDLALTAGLAFTVR